MTMTTTLTITIQAPETKVLRNNVEVYVSVSDCVHYCGIYGSQELGLIQTTHTFCNDGWTDTARECTCFLCFLNYFRGMVLVVELE